MQPLVVYAFALVFPLLLAAGNAQAADTKPDKLEHKRHYESTFRFSSEGRRLGITQWWQPIWQRPDRILYSDVRTMGDTDANVEGNVGLGYRQILNDAVYGGYMFTDRRQTDLGSQFWQTTWGAEYIRRDWEARANLYLPVNRQQTFVLPDQRGPYIAGNGIFVNDDSTITEEAQPGFDAEAGFRLPDFSRFVETARVYGGVYYFNGDVSDDIVGVRTRAKFQITPWLDLGVRAQYDDPRGAQAMAEVTLKFPRPKKFKADPDDLWSRLGDTPERDVDVVTGSAGKIGAPLPITVTDTGQTARVIFVNNTQTGAGSGTIENPYATLAEAMAHVQSHDTLYIAAGNGTDQGYTTGAHITSDHIALQGEGSLFLYDSSHYQSPNGRDYHNWILRGPGLAPLIGNQNGAGIDIDADDITIRGVQVDNSNGAGIIVQSGADQIAIEDTLITGNTGPGLVINQTGNDAMNIRVRGSVISGNQQAGVYIDNQGLGDLNLDLGRTDDFGYNDIYGNLSQEIYANTNGHIINAEGNYWGGGALGDTAGPSAGMIVSNVYTSQEFCASCQMQFSALHDTTNATAGGRVTSNGIVASGFRGHRYVMATGTANPELIVNGVASGTTTAQISAGDQIALGLDASTMGLNIQTASLQAGANTYTYQATTEFLPNVMPNLIGWWDGHDSDADFHGSSEHGALYQWIDKSGNGLNALQNGGVRTDIPSLGPDGVSVNGPGSTMGVANNFLLSSLSNSMTVAMVVTPSSAGGPILTYGACQQPGQPCVSLAQGPNQTYVLRITTQDGHSQEWTASGHVGTGAQLLTLGIEGNGNVTLRQNGQNILSSSYQVASGFGSNAGLGLVQAGASQYHEMALFHGTMGDTDQNLVEAYLRGRWGIDSASGSDNKYDSPVNITLVPN
jgi:hypothetical protein